MRFTAFLVSLKYILSSTQGSVKTYWQDPPILAKVTVVCLMHMLFLSNTLFHTRLHPFTSGSHTLHQQSSAAGCWAPPIKANVADWGHVVVCETCDKQNPPTNLCLKVFKKCIHYHVILWYPYLFILLTSLAKILRKKAVWLWQALSSNLVCTIQIKR